MNEPQISFGIQTDPLPENGKLALDVKRFPAQNVNVALNGGVLVVTAETNPVKKAGEDFATSEGLVEHYRIPASYRGGRLEWAIKGGTLHIKVSPKES